MRIGIFTGTRADYGLLRPLAKRLENCNGIELAVFASGTHLSREYGYTVEDIELDGYQNIIRIPMNLGDNTKRGICVAMGDAFLDYSKFLENDLVDVMIILGDRYEAFVMASVCHIMRVPIAHIHGGEVTEGAIDDALRHSITKMASLHFVSCEEHRRRVMQLGEMKERVFDVGALGVENIINMNKMDKVELERSIGFELGDVYALATCHPETLGEDVLIDELFMALDRFKKLKVIFTGSNADDGGRIINEKIKEKVRDSQGKYFYVESLGLIRYLSAVKHCDFVIGNSSSGIIEVPQLGKVSVNIGERQKGRKRSGLVLDVKWDAFEIGNSIKRILNGDVEAESYGEFGDGSTSELITKKLVEYFEADSLNVGKKFNDLGCIDG